MTIDKKGIECPHCGKKGTWTTENPFRPFCSERCKLMDLGKWADETHRVPGDPINPNDISDSHEED